MEGLSEHPSNEGGTVTITLQGGICRGDAADPNALTGVEVGCLAEDGGGHESVSVALEL